MKYYSEITKQTYASEKDCLAAEANELKNINDKKALDSKDKKQLAKEIEDAEACLTTAYADYEKARAKAAEILEKSNAEAAAVLDVARKAIKAAEAKKYESIKAFTSRFGSYVTYYDNNKVDKEFLKSTNYLNTLLNDLFRF